MSKLTHFNKEGEAHMVNVGEKPVSHRIAVADGRIRMQSETLKQIKTGGHKKGDVLGHCTNCRHYGRKENLRVSAVMSSISAHFG